MYDDDDEFSAIDLLKKFRPWLKWVPLALATVLVLFGALAFLTAGAGHDDDLARQSQLLHERTAQADAVEAKLHDSYLEVLSEATSVNADRLEHDQELLSKLVADDLTSFSTVTDGTVVLAGISGTQYTWFVEVVVDQDGSSRTAVMTPTLDEKGVVVPDTLHWSTSVKDS